MNIRTLLHRYLGEVGTEPPYGPMDMAAWFEAYVGERWYTFDARNNMPRIGRVLIARGRDAWMSAVSPLAESSKSFRLDGCGGA